MAFKIPSLNETRDFILAVGKFLFQDRNYGNLRSYHAKRGTFLAAAVTQLHSHIDSAQNDTMPDTAPDDGPIDRWGGIVKAPRKGATGARALAVGRVRGTNGTSIPAGTELTQLETGLRFQIAQSTTIPAALFIDADISAIDTGSQTRLLKGVTLNFTSTPPGAEGEVVLQRDLDQDGFDAEQFGAYRRRVLDKLGNPPAGGNQADFVEWMLQVTGVAQAYCYPSRAGLGTVDIVGLHSGIGIARELTGGESAALLAYVKTLAPAHIAGVVGALRHLDVVADSQNVEIIITPDGQSANAFDWTGGPLTVLSWTGATRTLQFTTARPASMAAGHRIVIKGVASSQDSREFKIESLASTDSVVLEVAPTVNPAATDTVYSGGPLTSPIRNAILAHMDGETVYAGAHRTPLAESALDSVVGLEVIADGIGPANPSGVYGTWIGGLIRSTLFQLVAYKSGVRNVNIVTPAADYDAVDDVFPFDTQIHMIVPGSILIRGA